MDRDLTINLKIAGPVRGDAQTAVDAVKSVAESAQAATAAQTALASASRTAAGVAQTTAEQHGRVAASVTNTASAMGRATTANREYATSFRKFDEAFAEFEAELRQVNGTLDQMEANRRRITAADREFLEGVQRLTGGLTQMARSVVLLTAANEEDAAAMLKTIARFEAVAQSVNGVIGVVQGATKAWQQYAIAAELAGNTATAGGFLGRMAGTGAALSSVLGGSIGLFSAGSLVYQNADNYFNGTNKTYAEDAIASRLTSFAGAANIFGGAGTLFKPYQDSYLSQQKTAQMEGELTERQRLNRRRDEWERLRGLEGLMRGQVAFETDLQQSRFVAGIQDPARNPNWQDSFQSAYRVNTATDQALRKRHDELTAAIGDPQDPTRNQQNVAEAVRQREDVERRIADTQRERLSIMQQEAELASRIVASQRESLAQMSRGDTKQLASALKAVDSGEELTARQIAILRRNNIVGYDQQLRSNEERLISRNPDAAYIYQNQREKAGVEQLNHSFNVAVSSEMVLKVQAELDSKAPQWIAESMRFVTQQVERIKDEANSAISLKMDEMRRQFDQSEKAKGK